MGIVAPRSANSWIVLLMLLLHQIREILLSYRDKPTQIFMESSHMLSRNALATICKHLK